MKKTAIGRDGSAAVGGVTLVLTAVVTTFSPMSGQDRLLSISSVEGHLSRVVFPTGAAIAHDDAQSIMRMLNEERDLPGLPAAASIAGRFITVSLAPDLPTGVDGRSLLDQSTIVLPLARWVDWEPARLRRVLRHELTHIAVGRFLGHLELPTWFEEGLAEWASGGLTCVGRARLGIETVRRLQTGKDLPSIEDAWDSIPMRLAYDFFASFFEFLETLHTHALVGGVLIQRTHDLGLETALQATYGLELQDLEVGWTRWLRGQHSAGQVLAECDRER
ncbi:MAG: hypothetical protein OXT72_06315 [Gammaproteobacteria bacterium]|nr:hypothetical protein [Gammaproteobacteria bacterium]MDE2875039.1 hypothetical protein [Gemmatimonadota bacterium]